MYQEVSFQSKASYLTSHKPNGREKEIWVVLHGYGQLAPFFLQKFESIFDEKRLIIAPEAMNYNYLKGYSGRVGANWMTKHQRELAIENNNQFLNAIIEQVLEGYRQKPDIHVLGFSQGSATASRWAAQLNMPIKKLVLWGGGFAHDVDLSQVNKSLKDTRIIMVWGNKDHFLTEDRLKEQEEILNKINLKKEKISYKGGHDIYPAPLKEIL
ncbi:alpha/beta hydrolase [Echinicola shivajiensis]|uniref:alpha/beta hydrolase n=1 Tax=Echinicola shivajiensis TaxID=1035916 RepID=UPI001BFC8A34|nr:alpha/beta fold hydrolase [Echinicola shivajiensis]